jgi:endonuclease III
MRSESERERLEQITRLLLANRQGTEDWGEIANFRGQPCPKKVANKFLVCCLLDWRIGTDRAWKNGYRLVERILGDPEDIWRAITSVSEAEWASRKEEYNLHTYRTAHERLWKIAKQICEIYQGDASHIWVGREAPDVLARLLEFGGEQIPRMIVGALRDCGQIQSSHSDLKADTHVCRALGRAVLGKEIDEKRTAEISRQLHVDPWQLDWPLWNLGKYTCLPRYPVCSQCFLSRHCFYAQNPTSNIIPDIPFQTSGLTSVSYDDAEAEFAKALSVTTYNSAKPRFLYFEFERGRYEKANFEAYAAWIERSPKKTTYPEWVLKPRSNT